MESTVRIAYSGAPSSPVIKIITPKQIHEDADPKDELIRDFLYTASVKDRNKLFYLYQHFDLESPFKLATIAPISYHDEPERIREHVELRVLSFDSVSECREFYHNWKRTLPTERDTKSATKCPADYSTYLKIREFFDWVNEQPYIEKGK